MGIFYNGSPVDLSALGNIKSAWYGGYKVYGDNESYCVRRQARDYKYDLYNGVHVLNGDKLSQSAATDAPSMYTAADFVELSTVTDGYQAHGYFIIHDFDFPPLPRGADIVSVYIKIRGASDSSSTVRLTPCLGDVHYPGVIDPAPIQDTDFDDNLGLFSYTEDLSGAVVNWETPKIDITDDYAELKTHGSELGIYFYIDRADGRNYIVFNGADLEVTYTV